MTLGHLFGQQKYDTLVIASKKYPLQRTKMFHNSSQDGTVLLPSEYKELRKNLVFKSKDLTDSIIEIDNDEDGNEFITVRWSGKSNPSDTLRVYLHSLTDTLEVKIETFSSLNPYIKIGTKKIYFTSGKVIQFGNGGIKTIIHKYKSDRDIFSYWRPYSWKPNTVANLNDKGIFKGTTFILKDLYYAKGNSTYYLDREFVIIFK